MKIQGQNIFEEFLKVPKLDEMKNILCVQPHPDDVDLSIGGIVAKLTQMGAKITYVTVTDGSAGTLDESIMGSKLSSIRKREQEEAAKILGVSELIWLDFEDLGSYTVEEVRVKIVEIIREKKPDAVLTVDPFLPYEAHPDHTKCGLATAQAVLFYRLPKILGGSCEKTVKIIGFFNSSKPNTIFELTEEDFQRKMKALSCHRSQFDEGTLQMIASYFTIRSQIYKTNHAVETLKILPPIALHVFPEVEQL
ncbi:PIG-L deacetylase family protein [Pseudothermotoga thermarum]|uniref:LmbE family protein n=1 Tax=Pseudothermotoga thermarum DSM 5069 TaxID=688269 RepID=F7YW52_9THEM|nr:PIG-L deacetylase family protein [Pseudothermotoga thermarum]AEH50541.1 LmbE family protein [Pseudothermotoga thermarum DSM 5069]